ncbi:MAG: 50S ribosomal protein L25 [Actinobacteria bacterium]|nr:50S ribosomal protein L25 [Actinomycetota bacterium]
MSTDRVTLPVSERTADQRGTRNVGRLRRSGVVPGVVYGSGEPRAIAVGERELRAAFSGPSGLHAIFDVVIQGEKPRHVVVKEFQRHPVRGTLTHVDFHEVRLDRPIQATVSVQLVGEARGSKLGGQVQSVVRHLRIEALPTAMPDHIAVDVSDLDIGSSLRLSDVPPIEGILFLDDPEGTVLATCSIPRGMTTGAADEEAEGETGETEAGGAAEAADAESTDETSE